MQHVFFTAKWHRFSGSVEKATVLIETAFSLKMRLQFEYLLLQQISYGICVSNNTKGDIISSLHGDLFCFLQVLRLRRINGH